MKIDKEKFLKKILLKEESDTVENLLVEELSSYLQENNIEKILYTLLTLLESKECNETNVLQYVEKNYQKVYSLFEDFDLKIPEIQCAIEKIISEEEGVGGDVQPTNSTDGIDAKTPRIIKKKDEEQKLISR